MFCFNGSSDESKPKRTVESIMIRRIGSLDVSKTHLFRQKTAESGSEYEQCKRKYERLTWKLSWKNVQSSWANMSGSGMNSKGEGNIGFMEYGMSSFLYRQNGSMDKGGSERCINV